jgi:hypothetical protein
MLTVTPIKPIERQVELIVAKTLSPQVAAEKRAKAARTILDRTDAHNARILGAVPPFETFVDGRESDDFKAVKPDGTIVRRYELILDVLKVIWKELQRTSPRGRGADNRPGHPGLYRSSHVLLADGVEVSIENPPPAKEYAFVSLVPYSRKLERRYEVYHNVERSAAVRKFGNGARIRFSYRSVNGGSLGRWASRTGLRGRRSDAANADWLSRQPAIIVTTK